MNPRRPMKPRGQHRPSYHYYPYPPYNWCYYNDWYWDYDYDYDWDYDWDYEDYYPLYSKQPKHPNRPKLSRPVQRDDSFARIEYPLLFQLLNYAKDKPDLDVAAIIDAIMEIQMEKRVLTLSDFESIVPSPVMSKPRAEPPKV